MKKSELRKLIREYIKNNNILTEELWARCYGAGDCENSYVSEQCWANYGGPGVSMCRPCNQPDHPQNAGPCPPEPIGTGGGSTAFVNPDKTISIRNKNVHKRTNRRSR